MRDSTITEEYEVMPDTFTSGDIASAASATPAETTPAAAASPAPQPAEPAPASAPTTEAQPASAATTEKPESGIPPERHKEILEKTRREYDDKLARFKWAERYDPERVSRAMELAELYERQPDKLYAHLGSRIAPPPEAPKPDLRTEDGSPLYSAEQAARLVRFEVEQASAALKAEIAERFGPIEAGWKQGQQAAAIDAQIDEVRQYPGFDDHLEAITQRITEANERREVLSLKDAYLQVVVPALATAREAVEKEAESRGRKAALDELNATSAAVADTVNPSRKPAATRKDLDEMSWREAFEAKAKEMGFPV